jgi:hypothetical protein
MVQKGVRQAGTRANHDLDRLAAFQLVLDTQTSGCAACAVDLGRCGSGCRRPSGPGLLLRCPPSDHHGRQPDFKLTADTLCAGC